MNDPEVLDGVRPDTRGTTVVVSAGALGTGETLEVRLDARFAATEAEFAAFEVRGANGFGDSLNQETRWHRKSSANRVNFLVWLPLPVNGADPTPAAP